MNCPAPRSCPQACTAEGMDCRLLSSERQTKGLAFYRWMDLRVWESGGGNGALGDCQ